MSYQNENADTDWRENKKLILTTIEKNGQLIQQHEKQLQDLKLHLQKIESNTEVIKTWMRSEKITKQDNKKTGIHFLLEIGKILIASLITLIGVALSARLGLG